MAKLHYLLGLLSLMLVLCNGLPVLPKEEVEEEEGLLDEEDTGLEYDKYLRQVIKVLEKDPEMRKRMEELSLEDLRDGNFARKLDFLGANIRSKLDELKRIEVNRLRTVARQRMEASMNPGSKKMDSKAIENMVGHVDPATMDKFTDQDFERLIKKAAADLDEADKQRRKEFKRYEMEKELQRRQQLKEMDDANKLKAEEEFKRRKEKIKNHPKLKHPGSKAQMQEVWEETDHLDPDDFNPKTFFALHDTNGDKKLDMFELEALFIKEVEKIYKDKDADPREKFEEMSRMREHVLREIDLDGDKMVSRDEFLKAADQAQFENDEGWKDINQEDQFTEDELQEYNRMVQERLERKKMKMQQEKLRREGFNVNEGNVQMNQQVNQPPPVGGDPKLRVNQPPPINQQVPSNQGQINVNQAAAQQAAQQAAAQQAAQQQAAAQQAAAQQAAAQQAAAQQAAAQAAAQAQAGQQAVPQQGQQVPPQQGQQQGGVPQQQQQQQQSNQQQQLTQQQQEMIEAQRQHQLKLQQEAQRQQQLNAQQQINAQQQLDAQQQQLNAQKQQQLNAQQQQQVNAQQQQLNLQQQQLNAQQQQQNQQQQNIPVQQGQGQPGQPPAQPGQPVQGGQPPAQPGQPIQGGQGGQAPAPPPGQR